jgi:hypothetical protein
MLAKTTIALSASLAFAAASSALAMTNAKNSGLSRTAAAQQQTTTVKHSPTPTSLAVRAWLDHHQLGYGT